MEREGAPGQSTFQTARLQEILRDELPMAAFMGVEVVEWDEGGLTVRAPEGPSVNAHGTMFGGSIGALALLAGWGLVRLRLRELGMEPDVVVQRTLVEYVSPIFGSAEARAIVPEPEDWDRFVRTLDRRGKGRVLLEIHVSEEGDTSPAALVDAWFVASTE